MSIHYAAGVEGGNRLPWRTRLLLFAFGTLVALVVLELVLRGVTVVNPALASNFRDWDPDAVQIELLGESCYRPRPGAAFHYENGAVAHINAEGYRGPVVRRPKRPGVFRVVLLGGSTSHGFGVDDESTIDAQLRQLLARQDPDRPIEVVNLGFDGYDSMCDRERFEVDALRLEPDAVILHSGINDVAAARFAPPRRETSSTFRPYVDRLREERRRGGRGVWGHLKHRLFTARLPGVMRHQARGQRVGVSSGASMPGPPSPPAHGPDAFESNLRRTAELAPPGAVLLFSTPPSSLRFSSRPRRRFEPHLVVDDATTQRYRDALDQRMRRVATDLAKAGRRAMYVEHSMPLERFQDDCHLDREGNRRLAADFAAALAALRSGP